MGWSMCAPWQLQKYTLEYRHERNCQELLSLVAQGCTTAHSKPEPTPRRCLDIAKDSTVCELTQPRNTSLLHGIRPIENILLQYATGVDLPNDAFADCFPHGGNTDHETRPEGNDITPTVPYGLIRES